MQQAQQHNTVPTAFRAAECSVDPSLPKGQQTTRIDTGLDGVMVPLLTDAEKFKRRKAINHSDQLTRWRSTLRGKVRKTAADRLLNYVSDRHDMINDPWFQQKS
ncbi:MAG: hypothetical protein R3C49_27925 [Planctomycetaceae bacterium]